MDIRKSIERGKSFIEKNSVTQSLEIYASEYMAHRLFEDEHITEKTKIKDFSLDSFTENNSETINKLVRSGAIVYRLDEDSLRENFVKNGLGEYYIAKMWSEKQPSWWRLAGRVVRKLTA